MGALTDNRKRFSDNFSLSPALASPYLPNPEYAVNLPPLKKPRITSMPSVPDKPRSSQASGSSISRLGQFPPPQPLSRTVHAPQRCSKFSGSAIPLKAPQKESNQSGGGMGIFKSLVGTVNRFLTGRGHADTKGLSKEEYKKLVEVRQGHSVFSEHVRSDVWPGLKVPDSDFRPSSSTVVSDSTVLIEKAEKGKEVIDLTNSVNHEVEEEMEMWTERQPVYKELYESVKKRDLKLISLDFEVKITEQKISAFGIASRSEDVARDAFVPLTDEEEDLVGHALFGPNRREVLVAHESSNIEITRQILQCLGSGAWLNDEVINLYLELLKEREKREPKKFLKCHFFNTFFYKKLVSGVKGYDFKAVRRWTTQKKIGYGLIECDKIFVPIHKDVHWCLAIINVKDEKFQYLDSLGGRDTEVLRVLARYFVDEVKEKSNKDVDVSSWKQDFVDDLPEQQNGYDCGMFMIKYADFYSRGLGLCFNQGHMPYFRKRTAKEILRLKAE